MKTVSIIRGPSGSGKSTFVDKNFGSIKHRSYASADQFFMFYSIYRFDPTKVGEAHARCMENFLHYVQSGEPLIVVDNTFIHEWEYINYKTIAEMIGYKVDIYEIRVPTFADAQVCARRNKHGVPANIVYTMCCEFEPYADAIIIPFVK